MAIEDLLRSVSFWLKVTALILSILGTIFITEKKIRDESGIGKILIMCGCPNVIISTTVLISFLLMGEDHYWLSLFLNGIEGGLTILSAIYIFVRFAYILAGLITMCCGAIMIADLIRTILQERE